VSLAEPKKEEAEPKKDETAIPERRLGVERRRSDRRVAARALNANEVEHRVSERRLFERRVKPRQRARLSPPHGGRLVRNAILRLRRPDQIPQRRHPLSPLRRRERRPAPGIERPQIVERSQ